MIKSKINVVHEIERIFNEKLFELKELQKRSLGLVLRFDYLSSDDDPSYRTVEVVDVIKDSGNGQIYLEAICLTRCDTRWFRLDRIEEFYDDDDNIIDYKTTINHLQKLCSKTKNTIDFYQLERPVTPMN